ncbi:hypothetical protein BRADI_1g78803v3 [Brachypodium distachyon]|uniref:Uncharacterized protein n=1 Tax=Brachypodium distachyon TaxID=15368 RepID=A0A2K2DVU7_BRADI|nr:hypothetical protein BRADI_1g78803v3 [Brachypodium distachyon]
MHPFSFVLVRSSTRSAFRGREGEQSAECFGDLQPSVVLV